MRKQPLVFLILLQISLKELIDLLRGEHKGDNGVFFERGNVFEGIFRDVAAAHQKAEKDPQSGNNSVYRT